MKPQRTWLERAGKQIELGVRYVSRPMLDSIRNWKYATAEKRFLVVRHRVDCSKYDDFLGWLERGFPHVRALFELRALPCRVRDWSQYALLVSWLPDRLLKQSSWTYARAKDNEETGQAHGVPVVNPVNRLSDASKSASAQLLAKAGFRTPQVEPIQDVARFRKNLCGMSLPLVIRDDCAQGDAAPIYLIKTPSDVKQLPLESLERPLAVEFIDVRKSHDRLYRKYRYVAAGDEGLAYTLQISDHWQVRGRHRVLNAATLKEETDYISRPDPNHQPLQRARRSMGLDLVAFDYSYDSSGQMVVWAAENLPRIAYSKAPGREHITASVERGFAAMAKLYLQRAGMPVPHAINTMLAAPQRATQAA